MGATVAIKNDGALTGAPAHQIGCTGELSEKWTLSEEPAAAPSNTADHLVKIVNTASGMCLESSDAERKFRDATQVVQRPCSPGNSAQLWILNILERSANSVDVRVRFLGLKNRDCLNVNGEATANGAYIVRWQCHNPEPHGNEIFRVHAAAINK